MNATHGTVSPLRADRWNYMGWKLPELSPEQMNLLQATCLLSRRGLPEGQYAVDWVNRFLVAHYAHSYPN